jgi:hypothetical protein
MDKMTRNFNNVSSSSTSPINNNSATIGMEPSLFLTLLTDDQREMVSHLLSKLQHLPLERTSSSSYPISYHPMSDDDYLRIQQQQQQQQQQHLLDEALVTKVYKNIDFINVVLDIIQVLEGQKTYIDVPLSVIQPPQEQQVSWNSQPNFISQQKQQPQQQQERQEHRQQQQQQEQQQILKDVNIYDKDNEEEEEEEEEEELKQALQRYTLQKASVFKKESDDLCSSTSTRKRKKSSRVSRSSKRQSIPSAKSGEKEKLVEVRNVHKKKSRPYDNMMTMLSFTTSK